MSRPWNHIALLLQLSLICSLVKMAPAQAPPPSKGEIESLRRDLQQRQRERESAQETRDLVPWQPASVPMEMRPPRQKAAIRLTNEMKTLNAIWTFEPERKRDANPVRVLICLRGEQWIALEPGSWRVSLVAGRPNGGRPLRAPAQHVTIERGKAYELALTGEVEQQLKEKLKDRDRAAAKKQSSPEGGRDKQEANPLSPSAPQARSKRND